ncbi:MAG TPA: Ig-like domain-containing protein, partial [Thermoanaerobaculia bacterium]|nr:Ig-like domain-containing protein [Thermoanaerobaculia bacterium]
EFKDAWYARLEEARQSYGGIVEDRARMLLLHGPAAQVWKTDCQLVLWPLEIWHYGRTERLPADFFLIFLQTSGGGPYHLWVPAEGYDAVQALFRESRTAQTGRSDTVSFERALDLYCHGQDQIVLTAFRAVRLESQLGTLSITEYPPPARDTEWLATFLGLSTDLPKGAPPLPAHLTVGFPERRGDRTLVQGVLLVPRKSLQENRVDGQGVYNLLLTGEILKDEVLHESFRYRFDLPADTGGTASASVPLVFERTLRPGDYTLIVRLEDLTGKQGFRQAQPIAVPKLAGAASDSAAPEIAAALDSARQTLAEEVPTVRLVPPPGEVATGPLRIEAKVSGGAVQKVAFALDGKPLLTKANPPYSVSFDLGALPTPHTVRAVGLDAAGKEVATDELVLNGAPQRFAVRLLEPRRGERHARGGESLRARAEVQVPDGQTLDRLEFYLDERRVAMLFQPPFSLPFTLPARPARYLRAVAYLADGSTAEDLVLLNAPGYQENVDVPLV